MPNFTTERQRVVVKTAIGLRVATAASVTVSLIAVSLAVGILAALPVLQRGVPVAAVGGGEEQAPVGQGAFQYFEIKAGAFQSLEQTADGGYILGGWGQQIGHSDQDIYLVKTSGGAQEGVLEWSRFFGGSGDDIAFSVIQSVNQRGVPTGYVLAGATTDADGSLKATVMKTDPAGTLDPSWPQNPRVFGPPNTRAIFFSLAQAFDAAGNPTGFVLAGETQSVTAEKALESIIEVVKIDERGNLDAAWSNNPRIVRVGRRNAAYAIQQTFDRHARGRHPTGFVLAGEVWQELGNTDLLLARLNLNGTIDAAWPSNPRTFHWEQSEHAKAIRQTFDAAGNPTGFVLAGKISTNLIDALLLKVDGNGMLDTSWPTNPVRFGAEGIELASDVRQTFNPDGTPTGYIFTGEVHSPSLRPQGEADAYLVRTDLMGKERWRKLLPGTGYDTANAIQQVTSSRFGYALAGQTQSIRVGQDSDAWLVLVPSGQAAGAGDTPFRRGDADGNGRLDLTDAIFTLSALFKGGPQWDCLDAGDADDNGVLNLTDAVFTLNYLFRGSGLEPPPPGLTQRGQDPTPDGLNCLAYPAQ